MCEADFILVIMRVTNQYLVNVHNDQKGEHRNDHGQGQVTIAMEATAGWGMLWRRVKIDVKVSNGLWDDIEECDWEEKHAWESHGHAHDGATFEALESRDEFSEDQHLCEEDKHENEFNESG